MDHQLHVQLEQGHELLVVEVFGECVCARSHHHIAIVVDQTDGEENGDELPLGFFESFILNSANGFKSD